MTWNGHIAYEIYIGRRAKRRMEKKSVVKEMETNCQRYREVIQTSIRFHMPPYRRQDAWSVLLGAYESMYCSNQLHSAEKKITR